jgi:hypothetical protein
VPIFPVTAMWVVAVYTGNILPYAESCSERGVQCLVELADLRLVWPLASAWPQKTAMGSGAELTTNRIIG